MRSSVWAARMLLILKTDFGKRGDSNPGVGFAGITLRFASKVLITVSPNGDRFVIHD